MIAKRENRSLSQLVERLLEKHISSLQEAGDADLYGAKKKKATGTDKIKKARGK